MYGSNETGDFIEVRGYFKNHSVITWQSNQHDKLGFPVTTIDGVINTEHESGLSKMIQPGKPGRYPAHVSSAPQWLILLYNWVCLLLVIYQGRIQDFS